MKDQLESSDPLARATSVAPPTIGDGCLSRYDIDELSAEDGADFSQAPELLSQLVPQTKPPAKRVCAKD